jgi:hypothetical protein
MHDADALTRLLESREPFGGIVLSIGVTLGQDREGNPAAPGDSINRLVETLLANRMPPSARRRMSS